MMSLAVRSLRSAGRYSRSAGAECTGPVRAGSVPPMREGLPAVARAFSAQAPASGTGAAGGVNGTPKSESVDELSERLRTARTSNLRLIKQDGSTKRFYNQVTIQSHGAKGEFGLYLSRFQ